jgi:hypothetical protein
MPVIASKSGYTREFSCAAWLMMDIGNDGWTMVSQDCGNESQNNGAHQAPYAYGYTQYVEGNGDKHYTHSQGTASNTWSIIHNMNKHPTVSITDTGGNEVMGQVKNISVNEIEITFSSPFTGKAYLN